MGVKPEKIVLGTRGSPLALKQTDMVRSALLQIDDKLRIEVKVIKTSGDWIPSQGETRLKDEEGGKGLFAKELEEALLRGEIDAAVHSMKDMPWRLPEGLVIPFMLPREDVRDSIILSDLAKNSQNIKGLPQGLVVGTSSVRRQAFLLHVRPDFKVVPLRGNVQTRIDKLRSGQVGATLLAMAGLRRLGLEREAGIIVEPEEMLPAVGQGAVGIEVRKSNIDELAIFGQISCEHTVRCVEAERAALAVLDGSCHTPIGAYACLDEKGGEMNLRLCVASLDGRDMVKDDASQFVSSVEEARIFGAALGEKLKARTPPHLLQQLIREG